MSQVVLDWSNTVRVKAAANVLGLQIGQESEIPVNTPDLAACVTLGTILLFDHALGEWAQPPEHPYGNAPCGSCGG